MSTGNVAAQGSTTTAEPSRALIAVVRKVVFAGLVLLGAWLLLLALRGFISPELVERINEQQRLSLPYETSSWDWNTSIQAGLPISEMVGPRLSLSLRLIGTTGLFSLILAIVLLCVGTLISRITAGPSWLQKLRSILRLVLVSGGSSVPAFGGGSALFLVLFTLAGLMWGTRPGTPADFFGMASTSSLLPAWLLVQSGHGELVKWHGQMRTSALACRVAARLVIRLLELIGVIAVVTSSVGIGGLLITGTRTRDFPVVFRMAWILVVIVTLAKLVASLAEIVFRRITNAQFGPELDEKQLRQSAAVPKGWLVFSLGLVAVLILVAMVGPFAAPFGYNEIHFADRFSPPSWQHLFGTDNLGRDVFSRVLYGLRLDVLVGAACAAIIIVPSTLWSMLASYLSRKGTALGDTLEQLVMFPAGVVTAFPWLMALFVVVGLASGGLQTLGVILVVSLVLFPRAMIAGKEALCSLPESKEWLSGLVEMVPIVFLFTTAASIIFTATLSYSGFGLAPPAPELGNVLSSDGRFISITAPWIAWWPFGFLALSVLILVMAGNALLERTGFRSRAVWAKTME